MNDINGRLTNTLWRLEYAYSSKNYLGLNRVRMDLIEIYGIRDAIRYAGPRKRTLERQLTRYFSDDGERLVEMRE